MHELTNFPCYPLFLFSGVDQIVIMNSLPELQFSFLNALLPKNSSAFPHACAKNSVNHAETKHRNMMMMLEIKRIKREKEMMLLQLQHIVPVQMHNVMLVTY